MLKSFLLETEINSLFCKLCGHILRSGCVHVYSYTYIYLDCIRILLSLFKLRKCDILANLLTLRVPDEGYSSNVPDEGYSSNVPDEGYSSNVPDEGYSRNVPDEGYSSNVPDEGYYSKVPDEGYSSNLPDEGYSRNASCALS